VSAQKTVQFRISVVYTDVDDMDGFGAGDSDPQWDYEITDNTYGENDNGSTEISGTNCAYNQTINDAFFSAVYDCHLPTSYTFRWSGFEDDPFGTDANTGTQVVNFTDASINPNQTSWANAIGLQTATASGDPCGSGGTVTWRIQLQYRVTGTHNCPDECTDPIVLPTAAEYNCGPSQTTTNLNVPIYAAEPSDATITGHFSDPLIISECGSGIIENSSPEDVWVRTTIPDSTGGVIIQFENEGQCTGFLCQTNVSYAWYTSSNGSCSGLEYRGCGAVSCFIGCNDGEIQVDGIAGEDVWVRIWEEDDQGHHIVINGITPTAPADKCYTAVPLSGFGCNYQATSPSSGTYAEPDLPSWTAAAHPGGLCQDGDSNPLTNTVWASNENMVWYTYTHSGGDFNLAIDNMNCSGGAETAQIGVFSNSGTPSNPSCDLASETGYGCSVGVGQVQLSITSLPVGNYIIVVDGNAGAQCDWVFTDLLGNDPLPVELFGFEANLIDMNQVQLVWATGSEDNNDYFVVQRSRTGEHWEDVTTVDGAGNSSSAIRYEAFDFAPYMGVSYYRIKQVDFDGAYTTSTPQAINNKNLSDILLYPNPVSSVLTVEYESDKQPEIYLINQIGHLVPVEITFSKGKAELDVSQMPGGVYFVRVKRDDFVQTEKFIITH